jgi:FkbM family methyltransferase
MGRRLTEEQQEMTMELEGWIWPYKDVKCWPWLQNEKDLPDIIASECEHKRVIVEAGGNAGFYVKAYAALFDTVYTFEPDNLNFFCLSQNVREKNVIKMQACIGHSRKQVSMITSRGNIGMYHVDRQVTGIIPIIQVDDLNLEICDCIHFDIEGFEFEALKGSIETIKRCKPVIALEWMDHSKKFDAGNDVIESWLTDLGYRAVKEIYHEKIFRFEK